MPSGPMPEASSVSNYALMGDSRRRRPLGNQNLVAILVDGHQVCEGASGIDTYSHDMTA